MSSRFEWLDKFKIPIALSLVGLVLILVGIFSSGLTRQRPRSSDFPKESLVSSQKVVSVDVSGSVQKPGVYELPDGARIEDAVLAAGGFSGANLEYISKHLNMAQKISDGTKVYIPSEGESGQVVQGGALVGANTTAKININTSSQGELESLPGIGPVTASKIISDRPYGVVEELLSKKIVSKSVFQKIKDSVVVY